MKYAFMSFSCRGFSLAEMLKLAANLGYDGIEPRTGHAHGVDHPLSADERRKVREQVAGSGVALCCLAIGSNYADPDKWQTSIDNTRRYIELAHDLGCSRIRVFGGKLGENTSRDEGIALLTKAFTDLAADAAAAGTMLCLETHDDWTDPEHVSSVMRQVNHPAIGINWDMLHPTRSAGVAVGKSFDILQQWIRHVHVHDCLMAEPLQFRPLGEGELDIRAAFAHLVENGYDGYISGEWIDAAEVIDLGEELRRMKALEAEFHRAPSL